MEEREITKAFRSNQVEWEAKCDVLETKFKKYQAEKEAEIIDLKEQIRDLMFYMEAQNVIANSELKDEISTGSVTISPGSAEPTRQTRRRKK